MVNTENWKILVGFLGLVIVGIIIYMATKSSSGSSSNSNTNSNESKSKSNESRRNPNSNPNNSSPNDPSPNKPSCFAPEEQCQNLSTDDSFDIKCFPWTFSKMQVGLKGSACADLNGKISERDECSKEYQDFHNKNCGDGIDPIREPIRNDDRNNNPCPGDCQRDSNKLLNCYVTELQSANDACEFKSKTNTGDPRQNCMVYGNSKNLNCLTELTTACQNVLSRMPPQCGK